MINFRYHIVSLMAVFIALSVGIAVGVSLGPSVDQGLLRQAEQDRKQVAELRAELNRRNALDEYREAYDEQAGQPVIQGALNGVRVAVVTMPDAPGRVVTDVSAAVAAAGGSVVREVQVRPAAFDPAKAEEVTEALGSLAVRVPLNDEMTQAEKIGPLGSLDRLAAGGGPGRACDRSGRGAVRCRICRLNGGSAAQAQLVLVVAAEASDPPVTSTVLSSHVEFDVALKARAGVVLAGPNSAQIEGTDVLAARTDPKGSSLLSTVDVADLSSGVVTTVLAGQEQLLGRVGQHYGGARAGGSSVAEAADPLTGRRWAAATAGVTAALVAGLANQRVMPDQAYGSGGRWIRLNHVGQPVTLAEGPIAIAGLLSGVVAERWLGAPRARTIAVAVAVSARGSSARTDDLWGGASQGFRGHLRPSGPVG